MNYKKAYTDYFLKIRIFTNSKTIFRLIDNFLDFTGINLSKPKIKIDFYLDEVDLKNPDDDRNFLYQSYFNEGNNLSFSFGNRIASVTTNLKSGIVKGTIFDYKESSKERILNVILMQPLYPILAHHGLFFLHTSMVNKGNDCVLIAGPRVVEKVHWH